MVRAGMKSATFVEPVLAVCETTRLCVPLAAALLGRCSPNDISKALGIGFLPLNLTLQWARSDPTNVHLLSGCIGRCLSMIVVFVQF